MKKGAPLEALDRAWGCRRRVEKHAAFCGACDGLFGGHKYSALVGKTGPGKIHRMPSQTDGEAAALRLMIESLLRWNYMAYPDSE